MKVCVYTLGCKVNQYESGAIMADLLQKGYDVTSEIELSDIYIINTCAVTNEAEKKSRQIVSRVRKLSPNRKIVICGCSSQNSSDKFITDDEHTLILGTNNKHTIVDSLEKHGVLIAPLSKEYEDMQYSKLERVRSYIKIQDGCDNFCSYCIVPYLRGRSRSRDIESIVKEVEEQKNNVKEFVITGINISDYGKQTGRSLIDVLKHLQNHDYRIRLGSLESSIINEDFLKFTKDMPNFCPHFHLSLQSGSDSVLSRMNRKYTANEYLQKIQLIRKYFDNCGITTDIIAGFPTETNSEHECTKQFVEKVGFSDIHVFSYSNRKGTVASNFKMLDSEIVKRRTDELLEIKKQLKQKFLQRNIGSIHEILIEQKHGDFFVGYTRNYIKAYVKVYDSLRENVFVKFRMNELFSDGGKFV